MTGSTHIYSAVLQGTTPQPLTLHQTDPGRLVLDYTAMPHVQASIRLTKANLSLLDALDTRQTPIPRVTVTATATGIPGGTQTRSFDLCIRGWDRDQVTGEPVLSLASDEAILEDTRPLSLKAQQYQYQTSLRSLINYALDFAIPGKSLEATPSVDADVSVYSDAVNYVKNSAAIVNTSGWSLVGSGTLARVTGQTWTANTSGTAFRLYGPGSGTGGYLQSAYYDSNSIFGGKTFMFRARQRNGGSISVGTAGPSAGDFAVFWSLDDGTGAFYSEASMGVRSANGQKDHVLYITFPQNTKTVLIRLYHGFTNSDSVLWSDLRASVWSGDPTDIAYWDGNTSNTALYEYIWQENNGLSYTSRTAMADRSPQSLEWPPGKSVMDFLAPIVQAAGFRLVCDEQRKWTLRDESYVAAGTQAVTYGGNLIDGTDSISRDDDVWCDGAVVKYSWNINGQSLERFDTYALSGSPSRVRYVERDGVAWPGPGLARYIVEKAQNSGRRVEATAVADWRAKTEQLATFTLQEAPMQVGKLDRVEYDLSKDRMTLSARTGDA